MRKRIFKLLCIVALMVAAVCCGYFAGNNKASTEKISLGGSALADDELAVTKEDEIDYLTRYSLPALRRLNNSEYSQYVQDLKVVKRADNLNIHEKDIMYPEKSWKNIYRDVMSYKSVKETVLFNGDNATELNSFLESNHGKRIEIASDSIEMDTPIVIPSNTDLRGRNSVLDGGDLNEIILINDCDDVNISGFILKNGNYGIFSANSRNIQINDCTFSENQGRPLAVIGGNNISLKRNEINQSKYGGIYLAGNINNAVISDNKISNNLGAANRCAGIVLTAELNENDIFDTISSIDASEDEKLNAPHNIVVYGNGISDNRSSGIYCDGSYLTYIINNNIQSNDKEGMCMDWGTIGTFVSGNTIRYNGFRIDQTDDDLKNDFINGLGRLSDGSSPAKLPGISLDNTMWNIIESNIVSDNAGSGIKSVRTSIENIICLNLIENNNRGLSNTFHFFGIELGAANNGGEEQEKMSQKMDFKGNYENIIAMNNIAGKHYSGIFLESDNIGNDIIDNSVSGATDWSIEYLGDLHNSTTNNHSLINSRGLPLDDGNEKIENGVMIAN